MGREKHAAGVGVGGHFEAAEQERAARSVYEVDLRRVLPGAGIEIGEAMERVLRPADQGGVQ